MDGVVSALRVDLGAGESDSASWTSIERVDKWIVNGWLSEWHGTEVQTRDCGVIYGGCL